MRKLLFVFAMLFCLTATAQKKFDQLSTFGHLPTGFGVELGSTGTKAEPWSYAVGTTAEFGSDLSKEFDLSVYAKAFYFLTPNFQLVGQAGVVDLINLQVGIGVRAILPTKGADVFVEPLLKTNGGRLNLGLRFKL